MVYLSYNNSFVQGIVGIDVCLHFHLQRLHHAFIYSAGVGLHFGYARWGVKY
jgi:hypothetical protein